MNRIEAVGITSAEKEYITLLFCSSKSRGETWKKLSSVVAVSIRASCQDKGLEMGERPVKVAGTANTEKK